MNKAKCPPPPSQLINFFCVDCLSRKNFDTQQRVLALIDKYFRVQCPCCNALFGSYDLLVEHCRRCFCQIMSQSRSYAIPLDTDLFFSTPYLSEKEEIEERTHCIQQMGKLISDLRSHQPATFNLSDGQKRSLFDFLFESQKIFLPSFSYRKSDNNAITYF